MDSSFSEVIDVVENAHYIEIYHSILTDMIYDYILCLNYWNISCHCWFGLLFLTSFAGGSYAE